MIAEAILAAALLVQQPENPNLAIGFQVGEGATLMLQERQGICPAGWRMAALFGRKTPVFYLACWRANGAKVELIGEDGTGAEVEVAAITWAPNKKPASG